MCTKTLQSPLIRGSEKFGDKSANNYWLWQLCRQSWAGFTLTFVPHRYCRKQARIWYRKLLVGQLSRETVRKSINEKKIDIGFGTAEYYRIGGGVTARKLYLHLHLGTNSQAVSAALVDGSIAVWKEKKEWILLAWWWWWWGMWGCAEKWGLENLTGFS